MSAVELKHFIITGLKSLFGEVRARWLSLLSFSRIFMLYNLQVGAALDFDVLKYNEDTRTAFLRVHSR